eukprot:g35321.t1
MRSVSSDSLTPNTYRSHNCLPQPSDNSSEEAVGHRAREDLGSGNGPITSPRAARKVSLLPSKVAESERHLPVENGVAGDHSNCTELPTIEEALKIIHNTDKLEPRLRPEGAPDGFFLHRPDLAEDFLKPKTSQSKLDLYPSYKSQESGVLTSEDQMNSGAAPSEDGNFSRDDDSVLRDNSLESDGEDSSRPAQEEKDYASKDECTSCLSSLSSQAESVASSGSSVKMTSFAERKMKKMSAPDSKLSSSQKTTPDSSELNDQQMASWVQRPADESPSQNQALASEMTQLGIRLEEKRRAIEAQKKRIEAIFAKHRQRLGKSAFLQLKKKEEGGEPENGASAGEDKRKLSLEERLSKIEDEEENESPTQPEFKGQDGRALERDHEEESSGGNLGGKDTKLRRPESPKEPEVDADIGEYNNAVAKLNSALSSLQIDMQRLAQQQESLMEKKNMQAWVIPVPKAAAAASSQRPSRSAEFSSPSPSPSRKPVSSGTRSPQSGQKKASAPPPKSPRHSRPAELKITPLTRVLTPPQNVDSLPHLRKFSPSQVTVQTKSSICFGEDDEEPDLDVRPKQRPVGPLAGCGGLVDEPSAPERDEPPFDLENEGHEEGEDGLEKVGDSVSDQVDPEQRSVGFFYKVGELLLLSLSRAMVYPRGDIGTKVIVKELERFGEKIPEFAPLGKL